MSEITEELIFVGWIKDPETDEKYGSFRTENGDEKLIAESDLIRVEEL